MSNEDQGPIRFLGQVSQVIPMLLLMYIVMPAVFSPSNDVKCRYRHKKMFHGCSRIFVSRTHTGIPLRLAVYSPSHLGARVSFAGLAVSFCPCVPGMIPHGLAFMIESLDCDNTRSTYERSHRRYFGL
jgi:hypothetical protein